MSLSFKSLDFFRRVKRELVPEITEVSWSGAALSVVAFTGMLFLMWAEYTEFKTITTESRLVLEKYKDTKDDTLQLNFNMDFPRLKCEYAKISATNFMGTHMAGMALRVNKIHLDGSGKAIAKYEEQKTALKHSRNEVHEGPVISKDLTAEKFHSTLQDHAVTIVSFCVSKFIWCEMLEPVWEKSALQLADEKSLGENYLMAKVNCSDASAVPLCRDEGVDTYPSIRVYRQNAKGKAHEVYHGERSVAAITSWASHIIMQGAEPTSKAVDMDKDGVMDSHDGVGCRMSGSLKVQKSPGMIKIQAVSEAHAFDWTTMDLSHSVTHMSFGPPPNPGDSSKNVVPPHIKESQMAMDGKSFTSAKDVPTTHEHMIKVVPHKVIAPHRRWSLDPPEKSIFPPVTGFGYVYHSNNIQKAGEVPEVRLNYDILPYTLQFAFKQDTLYDFLTGICAILGGVFVVSGITGRIFDKISRFVVGKETSTDMPY